MKRGIIQSKIHIMLRYRNSKLKWFSRLFVGRVPWVYNACRKRKIIQPTIYRILQKVNQVIYTLDILCVPNIMIQTQAVLQAFCWQGSIGLQYISRKREIIQPNIYRISPKGNQVIYALDTICEPNIMILARAVLQIFC